MTVRIRSRLVDVYCNRMKCLRFSRLCAGTIATVVSITTMAQAQGLELSLSGGRATIVARNVSVREILLEWGRTGDTTIVDTDALSDGRVTLELLNVPETLALRTLLRDTAGYVAAPRARAAAGRSRFDRIMILANSRSVSGLGSVAHRRPAPRPTSQPTGGLPRMGSAHPTGRVQASFTVTAAQQLLQQDDANDPTLAPDDAPPAFGNIPSTRPGAAMGSANQGDTASIPIGAFGATLPSNQSNVPQVTPSAR